MPRKQKRAMARQQPEQVRAPLKGFVLMPFGRADEPESGKHPTRQRQFDLFKILLYALNDAFYQNSVNQTVGDYRPIVLERADIGAGRSADLLENVFRKVDDCDFVVADLSVDNFNVALESGYALARDKYLVAVVQDDLFTSNHPAGMKGAMSDLVGRLYCKIGVSDLFRRNLWKKMSQLLDRKDVLVSSAGFFWDTKEKLSPFSPPVPGKPYHTFLSAWLRERSGLKVSVPDVAALEEHYRGEVVRRLYSAICPLWEKQIASRKEDEYGCYVFAARNPSNMARILARAEREVKILTTNLQGLVAHIKDIRDAIRKRNLRKVSILTLDPESEFVNFRGALIGREIRQFRQEMKDSLEAFKDKLEHNGDVRKAGAQVLIRIYREFPTQITYMVDDYIYSSVVSVNHQSRHNIMFKVALNRKGVESSFIQHWDTIWARAVDVG